MKSFKTFVLTVCVLAMAFCFAPPSEAAGTNLLDKMSDADWRALNIFFSNFCESSGFSSYGDFHASALEDPAMKADAEQALIAFAVSHNVINNRKLFKEDAAEGQYYIGKNNVNATIEKYFGIKGVKPQSAEDGFIIYKKDRYYWDDVFEGSPWFAGGQVVGLRENGDGTLSALVELYMGNDAFQDNVDKFDVKAFYAPKKTWKGDTAKYCEPCGYYGAKIVPHTYNGKKTYKLLEWRAGETPEAVRW